MVTSAVNLDTATQRDGVMSVCGSTCWPFGGPGLQWLHPLPAFGPPEFALVVNGRWMFSPAARGFSTAWKCQVSDLKLGWEEQHEVPEVGNLAESLSFE